MRTTPIPETINIATVETQRKYEGLKVTKDSYEDVGPEGVDTFEALAVDPRTGIYVYNVLLREGESAKHRDRLTNITEENNIHG